MGLGVNSFHLWGGGQAWRGGGDSFHFFVTALPCRPGLPRGSTATCVCAVWHMQTCVLRA